MPSAGAQTAKSKTLSKREVIGFLGRSKRTVETYIAEGRLPVSYVNGRNGKEAVFQRSEVERFKREMDSPMVRALPVPVQIPGKAAADSTAFGPVPPASALQHFLAEALRARPVDRIRPWLTLAEAVEYSGLPASYLLARAREGKGPIRAIDVGTGSKEFWRFHRASLAK